MAALVKKAEAIRQRYLELFARLFPRVVQNPIGGMVEVVGERERAHVRAGADTESESDGESELLISRSECDAEDVSDSPVLVHLRFWIFRFRISLQIISRLLIYRQRRGITGTQCWLQRSVIALQRTFQIFRFPVLRNIQSTQRTIMNFFAF